MSIFSTPFFTIVVSLFLMTVSSTYTGEERTRFLNRMTEFTDQAEVVFDRERINYCKAFGSKFSQNCSAWTAVRTECLENMLLDLESLDPENDLLAFRRENSKMLFEMYRKCVRLATNPCNDQDWGNIKRCVRELFMTVPAFKKSNVDLGNGLVLDEEILMGMNVDHVLTERMVMVELVAQAEMDKCTSKTLLIVAS